MRALALLTLFTAVACAPDVAVGPADAAAADAAADVDAALAAGSDAPGELPPDVAAPADVAVDAVVPGDVAPEVLAPPDGAADVDAAEVVVDPCIGKNCSDGNLCTSDGCSGGACVFLPTTATCTDGNPCTVGDVCNGGLCLPGAVTGCSDGLACTVDSCSPAVGCASVVSASCDDGNPCTLDGCGKSGCTHGAAPSGCDDGNPCTSDTCTAGACVHGYVEGAGCCTSDVDALIKCDDANPCTLESCVNSQCAHSAPKNGCCVSNADCTGGNYCLTAICDTAQPQGDHFLCTYEPSNPDCTECSGVFGDCNDNNNCTVDTCQLKPNMCFNTPIANCCFDKTDCDDGNACTVDACAGNSCGHAASVKGAACGTGGTCDGEGSCALNAPAGMVLIPSGTFWMGCNASKDTNCNANGNNDDTPQHKVTLSAYYMDVTETTVTQYKACVDAGVCTVPSSVQPDSGTYPGLTENPVNNVNWPQSQAYCKWRGSAYDLPTEAQWEMAARGSCEKNGSTAGDAGCAAAMRTYPWGEATPTASYAVFNTSSTAAVGSLPAGDSPYGLHDMAGNVWEWTRDWYSSTYYGSSPVTDPFDSTSTSYPYRVYRGGSFNYVAVSLRAGYRNYYYPSFASNDIGLRCMRSYP